MPRTIPENLFHQLALAVAAGTKVSAWCEANGVETRTAYGWHRRDAFQRLVAAYRRRAEDRAIGKMAKGLCKAIAKMIQLIEEGRDDRVKLLAAEILIDKLLQFQCHAELGDEIRQLNERLAAREERCERDADEPREADSPA